MMHYQMTLEEHRVARGSYVDPDRYRPDHKDYQPEMLCRTGDGHAEGTRDQAKVDCPRCLYKLANPHASYQQMSAAEFAHFIKGLGFTVYLAKRGDYGFITDGKRERVLSFSFTGGSSLSGNYGPPSRESGTGWALTVDTWDLKTAEDVRKALYARPPSWCGRGWKHYTTAEQHLTEYGPSSHYREI
jgi:hypothetical protein